MKKILSLLIIVLFISLTNVYAAACNNSELVRLQEIANKIKVNYEVVESKENVYDEELGQNVSPTIQKIKTSIYNITDDIFLTLTNDQNNETKTINYNDTNNGIYSFITDDVENIINYKIVIYSKGSNCDSTLIKTIDYKKPKQNTYAGYEICNENKDNPVCQEYISQDIPDISNLEEYLEKDTNPSNEVPQDDNQNKTEKSINYIYYYAGAGVIIIAGIAIYIIVSKKRSRL